MSGWRNRVSNHDLFDGSIAQALDGRTREYAVRGAAVDITRPLLVDDAHRLRQRASRIDLIIDDQRVPSIDVSYNTHRLGLLVVAQAALLHDCQRHAEPVRQCTALLGEALVGGNDRERI